MQNYLFPADILLPKAGYKKWAVIACDQYTSDKAYWDAVETFVGDAPSTLRITLPEIYLDESEERTKRINASMQEYLDNGIFSLYENSMIFVEREITGGAIRRGLVGRVDLETYEYEKGSCSLIRATEQTVAERIPPRVQIRKDAPIELPHVLMFFNDPDNTVLAPLAAKKGTLQKAYDFDLMQSGGHITGYFTTPEDHKAVNGALSALVRDGLLFAVGDGNHSLATAKECYKQNPTPLSRYALVEIVNIHDPAIEFEPIYRVLFGVSKQQILADMKKELRFAEDEEAQRFEVIDRDGSDEIFVEPQAKLPVGTLQAFLDRYLAKHPDIKIDYIHGTDSVRQLCKQENTVGFLFDGMKKDELFDAVTADGALPRKTFSMGHANDKRFYIEGRKIK